MESRQAPPPLHTVLLHAVCRLLLPSAYALLFSQVILAKPDACVGAALQSLGARSLESPVLALVAIAWPRHPARARSRSWTSTRRRGPSSAFGALLPAVALRARGSRSSALVGTLAGLALARPRQPARDRARLKCGQVQRHTAWATRAVLLPCRGRGARVRRGQELARGASAVRRSERVRSRTNLTRLVRIY